MGRHSAHRDQLSLRFLGTIRIFGLGTAKASKIETYRQIHIKCFAPGYKSLRVTGSRDRERMKVIAYNCKKEMEVRVIQTKSINSD